VSLLVPRGVEDRLVGRGELETDLLVGEGGRLWTTWLDGLYQGFVGERFWRVSVGRELSDTVFGVGVEDRLASPVEA
jgi:hypothetical protein